MPAAAERDGFRPCLRCRPELAPGNASVDGLAALARETSNVKLGTLVTGGIIFALTVVLLFVSGLRAALDLWRVSRQRLLTLVPRQPAS